MSELPLIEGAPGPIENPYISMDLDFFTLETVCEHDIYLLMNGHYVLYRAAHLPFTVADRKRLEDARIKSVFLFCPNSKDLRKFYESNLSTIIDSKKVDTKKKADILYSCAKGIAQDIFEHPENKEAIGQTKSVVGNTIKLLAKGSDAFVQMISLSGHDYYTYTHCVNVMTFSLSILTALGVRDQVVLNEAGMGALLHDVGKSKVPLAVLNKPGPLTDEEWKVMKQHPVFGFELLEKTPVPDRGRDIVIQHHEKISGVGYPFGLKGEEVPLVSQVVSICDAYDAMTTNRCYQKAMKPYDAFKIITNDMKTHFSQKLIETFIKILNVRKR